MHPGPHDPIGSFGSRPPSGRGRLYAIAGYDGNSLLSSIECYDPIIDNWEVVTSMGTQRCDAGVCVLREKWPFLEHHPGLVTSPRDNLWESQGSFPEYLFLTVRTGWLQAPVQWWLYLFDTHCALRWLLSLRRVGNRHSGEARAHWMDLRGQITSPPGLESTLRAQENLSVGPHVLQRRKVSVTY